MSDMCCHAVQPAHRVVTPPNCSFGTLCYNSSKSPPSHLLITPMCRVLLEKLTGLQLVKKFPAFHGTRRFITALTSVRHPSLSWASPIQSIYPHPTSWRSILILSTHLCLGLPSDLLPSGFPSKTLYTLLSSPIRATCQAHLILLDFITRTILGEEREMYRVLVGKPDGRRSLGRPRHRCVDNIRMDGQEVGCGYMDWIGLAQDRDRWRTLVSAVMNLGVP